jgi:hypothetical protein
MGHPRRDGQPPVALSASGTTAVDGGKLARRQIGAFGSRRAGNALLFPDGFQRPAVLDCARIGRQGDAVHDDQIGRSPGFEAALAMLREVLPRGILGDGEESSVTADAFIESQDLATGRDPVDKQAATAGLSSSNGFPLWGLRFSGIIRRKTHG